MAYADLDGIGRPVNGVAASHQWGDQVDDNFKFFKGDAAWTAATLGNSWVTVGAGYDTPGFRLVGDIVYLRGAIKSGTVNTTVFTLPVGYRPTGAKAFACSNTSAGITVCNVYLTGSGNVTVASGSATTFVGLDGIFFSVF